MNSDYSAGYPALNTVNVLPRWETKLHTHTKMRQIIVLLNKSCYQQEPLTLNS
jgi:hypothetical protein